MLVSRKDIQYESIEQGNFLKLPVEQYLGLLGIEAIPSQIAIINAVNSKLKNELIVNNINNFYVFMTQTRS